MIISRIRGRRAAAGPAVHAGPDYRESVDGVFEVLGDGVLLCLADDLEYPVRLLARRVLPVGGFLTGWLDPDPDLDGWVLADVTGTYPGYQSAGVAHLAYRQLAERYWDAFRNPLLLERGWELQSQERAAFVERFGADTLILPPAEAAARLEAFHGSRVPVPDSRTVGVIYDGVDGLLVVPDLARVQSMFSYPALAADPDHAHTLRRYLDDESITPAPLRRMADAHQETADEVFRSVLGRPEFSWPVHGEILLREYKPSYFARTPSPTVLVVGDRLTQLLGG
jgi:hypothetical protein